MVDLNMATATLPGGSGKFVNIPIGSDASGALQTAIKSLFTAAGKNFTANFVASGEAGKDGFFNLIEETSKTKVTDKAGANVQAIVDIGKDLAAPGAEVRTPAATRARSCRRPAPC